MGEYTLSIPVGKVALTGDLAIPQGAHGIVLFAHGTGSSRLSPRNRFVAKDLRDHGLATLLIDLLTPEEEQAEALTGHLRFNIDLLAERLAGLTEWVAHHPETSRLGIGYFGASTGAAAALMAAAAQPEGIQAIVSRGGRPDLAGPALPLVKAPTLLIVGGEDHPVIPLNEQAYAQLHVEKRLNIIPGATHLFEEPGALQAVARLAREWFVDHLQART